MPEQMKKSTWSRSFLGANRSALLQQMKQLLSWSTWSSCYVTPSAPGNSWSICSSLQESSCSVLQQSTLCRRICCMCSASSPLVVFPQQMETGVACAASCTPTVSKKPAAPSAPGQQLFHALGAKIGIAGSGLDKYLAEPLNFSITPLCSA